ncbi:MAG TPA: class F sortase [Actinomycetota bacterium]|nr:class F sortase [Actinomycetota bacterium]
MTAGRRRLAAVAGAVALLVLAAGCGGGSPKGRYAGVSSTTATRAPEQEAKGLDAARGFRSIRGYRATPVPVGVEIPRIGVVSSLDRLGRAPDGTVQEPSRWAVAGWYAPGTRPGDPGSAVILGHVDSKGGPAVFYRLRQLRRGDQIKIARTDGSAVRFVVQRTEQYPKDRFPTDEVYYPTLTPTLRLVTCGGDFDTTAGHYRSNVIVFATMPP